MRICSDVPRMSSAAMPSITGSRKRTEANVQSEQVETQPPIKHHAGSREALRMRRKDVDCVPEILDAIRFCRFGRPEQNREELGCCREDGRGPLFVRANVVHGKAVVAVGCASQ